MHKHLLTALWRLRRIEPSHHLDSGVLDQIAAGAADEEWLTVPQMPAMVHDVLLRHGVIEEPWLPGRAAKCQWVAEKDWVYSTSFAADGPGAAGRQWFLRFKGLDTIVDVYLNGEKIASSRNMYRELRVDVTGRLAPRNTLALHFHTVFVRSEGRLIPLKEAAGDPEQPVVRPANNYGTYLGSNPCFSRVGVFGDVILEAVNVAEIRDLMIGAAVSDDMKRGIVSARIEGFSRAAKTIARVRLVAPGGEEARSLEFPLKVEDNAFGETVEAAVDNPQLWWPRGYGDQALYEAEVTLIADGREEQCERRRVGFRRVTMPEPLHFRVNGVPVRLWGGNWVTPDWKTEVWDQQRATRLFDIAENANFNAFRVWAPVRNPADGFYDLADERGFMLWQDFHAISYSSDGRNRHRAREEATLQIKALKHHPSILMWCGGNEAAMWHDKEFRGPGGQWPGRVVVEEDVKSVCEDLDPDRYFHPNSPYHGIDANDPQAWDTHGYTNMWYVPGYDYLVFASEDTRISTPPLHSLKRFFAPEDLWPKDYSPVWIHGCEHPWPEAWRKHTTGSSEKKTGPIEQLHDATDPASLVYRLGMAASIYYQDVIERQRRGRPADDPSGRRRCGGYLVWKYNDSWPQFYSGKVDYFLEPYQVYYMLRRAYAPVLLSFDVSNYIWLWAVNDSREPCEGEVTIRLFHLDKNETVSEVFRRISVSPDQSVVAGRLDEIGIGAFRREHILYACLKDLQGRLLARTYALGDIERRLKFPDARLDVRVVNGALAITTDKFARSVCLEGDAEGDAFGWMFEDNWFDLLPSEEKIVRVLGRHNRGRITARPWFSPYATVVDYDTHPARSAGEHR